MRTRFLLGPAGSGKTFRCLEEIRAALATDPAGPPLILLAPKQATFQLERQLLSDAALPGFTRLQILSFDRLAALVLRDAGAAEPRLLTEAGRVMVLRALLLQCAGDLKRFQHSARRPGFAEQLSGLLAELQNHGISTAQLQKLSAKPELAPELRAKLADLALLSRAYREWLQASQLQDPGCLLEFAADAKARAGAGTNAAASPPRRRLSGAMLWLDGFAEMTPAETGLLAAVLPDCAQATLAFCLDGEPQEEASWLSIWAVVGRSYLECRERVRARPDLTATVELLPRDPAQSRFAHNPALAHLEARWSAPIPGPDSSALRLVACAHPDAEAVFAAREVLKFVRTGGRFRDVAVLVRHLEAYYQPLERAFRRYGIPYFLDRRESVAHHPLAELTRSALRTVIFDWRHEDWFAALKAGFAPAAETAIDRLENEALARGWRGDRWRKPFQFAAAEARPGAEWEALRQLLVPPFIHLGDRFAQLGGQPTGPELASALRQFWTELEVEFQLAEWTDETDRRGAPPPDASQTFQNRAASVHRTVWDQMKIWLENLERSFASVRLSLRDWLPVLEAGLAQLTVGVIPPALDQVLIGAIDRSRNPDLRVTFLLGLNEGVFPAPPDAPVILTESDRDALAERAITLGPDLRARLSRERFFGYIACTRSTERLNLTYSRSDAAGRPLNPSALISHLQRLFPTLRAEAEPEWDWRAAEHVCELAAPLQSAATSGAGSDWENWLKIPAVGDFAHNLRALREPDPKERLTPARAGQLYGPLLKTSVSRLENFASCPARFFIHSGLRAEERKVFELDSREQGNFQHDVLQRFHEHLQSQSRRWRDLTVPEAREQIGTIADSLMADFRDGLLRDSPQTQFQAEMLKRALQDFIAVIVHWMHRQYEFDPVAVEVAFAEGGRIPPWELECGEGSRLLLRGRIDRVDLYREPGAARALCVVMDYKSSSRKLDPVLLEHGIQLQLLSYLSVLRHWTNPQELLGAGALVPAGVFYVNLRDSGASGTSRAVLAEAEAARRAAYQHTGRFDLAVLRKLDSSGASRGDQFCYRLTKDGHLHANSLEALPSSEFQALLDQVERQLCEMGRRIYAGAAELDPYRKRNQTPCEHCDYAQVCRIDPWTHAFRVLKPSSRAAQANSED